MKKILIIGYVWPEPNSSAAGSHMLSLLRFYKQQEWQVEFASPAQQTDHMADLTAEGISRKSIKLNDDSFDDYISDFQPDIVVFDRFMMEEQFAWRVEKHCPNALRILDTVDLQCLRQARHQALKRNQEMTQSDLFSDIAKREIAAILRSDLSFIISSVEMDILVNTFKIDPVLLHHLPFMIDIKQIPEKTRPFSERQHFITIGNFRHAPNWDAVLHLQKIWPLIKKQLPDAQCHIYGAYPPPKATALNNEKSGFLVKGWAEDAHRVMEQARVCLAPLRFGAGIKGKLLDAMLMQTPSVTTSIGSEGMHDHQAWPGVITDDIEHFVQAAVDLYRDQEKWQRSQHNANSLLHSYYDRGDLSKRLLSKINLIYKSLEQHRLTNFTGAMLRHHTMASTKYMSQWIAAKNALTDNNAEIKK